MYKYNILAIIEKMFLVLSKWLYVMLKLCHRDGCNSLLLMMSNLIAEQEVVTSDPFISC